MSKHTGPLSFLLIAVTLIISWNIWINRPFNDSDVQLVIFMMPVAAIALAVFVALVLRFVTASRQLVRKPVAAPTVNVDDSDRDDADEPADDGADDSRNGQTVFQMAWKRERGR